MKYCMVRYSMVGDYMMRDYLMSIWLSMIVYEWVIIKRFSGEALPDKAGISET